MSPCPLGAQIASSSLTGRRAFCSLLLVLPVGCIGAYGRTSLPPSEALYERKLTHRLPPELAFARVESGLRSAFDDLSKVQKARPRPAPRFHGCLPHRRTHRTHASLDLRAPDHRPRRARRNALRARSRGGDRALRARVGHPVHSQRLRSDRARARERARKTLRRGARRRAPPYFRAPYARALTKNEARRRPRSKETPEAVKPARVAFCHSSCQRDVLKHWTRFRVDSWQDC
jgi:hypothetical protein